VWIKKKKVQTMRIESIQSGLLQLIITITINRNNFSTMITIFNKTITLFLTIIITIFQQIKIKKG